MNNRNLVLIYTVLTLALIGSSVLLAYEVKHYINTREDDPLADVRGVNISDEELIQDARLAQREERESIFFTFNRTTAFTPIATPVPIPTATPIPPPTPTPIIPAQGWKIMHIVGQRVQLRRYDDTPHIHQVGDIVKDPAPQNEDFEILELFPDFQNPRVRVRTTVTNTEGFISERHVNPTSGGQQRRQ